MRLLPLLLVGLLALSGCLNDASTDDAGPPAGDEDGSDATAAEPAPEPEQAPCEDYENYGVYVGIGTHYTASGPDGDQRVYEESNGRAGLQIEEDCPEDPDTRLA